MGKIDRLPQSDSPEGPDAGCVRSLRTQQRAQCQMPKTSVVGLVSSEYRDRDSFGNNIEKSPCLLGEATKQSKSVMICSVSFKLVVSWPIPAGYCTRWALNLLGFGSYSNIYGEFDPGSGRTLAACLTHASRTVKRSLLLGSVANG